MPGLADLEIGLMFWAGPDARKTVQQVKDLGIRGGQLGFPGEMPLDGVGEAWANALGAERFTVATVFCSYIGEDYADIPTVVRTVGLVPPETRAERIERTKAVSRVAKELAVDSVACHIGVLPLTHDSSVYTEVVDLTRELCDYCKENGQSFALETGQEPAKILLRFISDVDRPNLKVNFDPANMILYGTGDPLGALDVLKQHVVSVHCKDGDWPPQDKPEALGQERPLGQGAVGIPEFISKLKEIGYRGLLNIEREEPNAAKRDTDIRRAVSLLRRLIA